MNETSVLMDATDEPCGRCLAFLESDGMRQETVMPLPKFPPRSIETMEPCCHDCASADTLIKLKQLLTWGMARLAVANDRQESFRLPGIAIGLVQMQLMRGCKQGDLEQHQEWLEVHGILNFNSQASRNPEFRV